MSKGIGAAAISAGAGIANGLIEQAFAEKNRERNFYWNEKTANAADQRQRAQYKDLYSPQAMLDQYAAAGLSPSMMMSGGQSAVGGTPHGAQGGIEGPYPSGPQIDPLMAAQIANLNAQTNKTNQDVINAELDNEIQKLTNQTFVNKWNLLNIQYGKQKTIDGNPNILSFSDIAQNSKNYKEFEDYVLKNYGGEGDVFLASEEGRQELRNIYEANKKFNENITEIAGNQENASLILKIAKILNNDTFATLNATAQIKQLQQLTESAELTIEQKGAMNRLLDKMGDGTFRDIIIVLLMLIGTYSHANINLNRSHMSDDDE